MRKATFPHTLTLSNPLPQQKTTDPILLLCTRPRQGAFFVKFWEKITKICQNQQKTANLQKNALNEDLL